MPRSWLQLFALTLGLVLHAATPPYPAPTTPIERGAATPAPPPVATEEAIIARAVNTAVKQALESAPAKPIDSSILTTIDKAVEQSSGKWKLGFLTYYGATVLGGLSLLAAVYLFFRFRRRGLLEKVQDSLVAIDVKLEGIHSDVANLRAEMSKLRSNCVRIESAVDKLEARFPSDEHDEPSPARKQGCRTDPSPPSSPAGESDSRGTEPADRQVTPPSQETTLPSKPVPAPARETTRQATEEAKPSATDLRRQRLGQAFLREAQSAGASDFNHIWEAFVTALRKDRQYGSVESHLVYWDRTASGKFVEHPSDNFKDTGSCCLLGVDFGHFLFFPKLVESARQTDLPSCSIFPPDELFLRVDNLLAFTPPRVRKGGDGWTVVEEGEARYR